MTRYKILPCNTNTKLRIGILGGTFNPAHEGHRYISLEAIKRLNLHYVIWLVSPQNPLKTLNVRDSLHIRTQTAKLIKRSNKILVSDIEKHFKNNFTVNSIKRLKQMHPLVKFVWIMGADNILQIHKWHQWKDIFEQVHVSVFDRLDYGVKAARSKAAYNFPSFKMLCHGNISKLSPGKWSFFRIKQNQLSSTQIRSESQNGK